MAAFDRTLVCQAAPQQVWEAAHGSLITMNIARSTPGRMVIATDDRLGYVCLIAARDGGAILRLLIDRAQTVQTVLQAAETPSAMLAVLEATPAQAGTAGTGTRLLDEIKRAAESTAQATTAAGPTSAPRVTAGPSPAPVASPGFDPYAGVDVPDAPPPKDPDKLLRGWSGLSGWRLARNWPRLGKPGWMWPTLLPTLGALLFSLVLALILVATPGHVVTDPTAIVLIVVPMAVLGFGALAVMLSVAELQRGAYKLWQQTHDRQALLAYPYPVGRVFAKYTALFVGLGVVMAGVLYFDTRPHGFEGGGLSLEYPDAWTVYPHEGLDACADGSCVLVLTRKTPASIASTIWIYHYPTDFRDSKALRDAAWDFTLDAYYPDAALIEGVSREVGGYPAAGAVYHATDSESYCDEEAFLEDVYVVVEGDAYELQLRTPCEDTFARERSEFHAVLDSIVFSTGQEQVQAAGPAIVWAGP